MRLSAAKGRLDRSLNTAEQELQEAQQQILMLQVRIRRKPTLGQSRCECVSQREAAPLACLFVCLFRQLFPTFFRVLGGTFCKSQRFNSSFTPNLPQRFVFLPFMFL